ncbi:MAG: hypothetical protein ABEK50_15000 [bacterium]
MDVHEDFINTTLEGKLESDESIQWVGFMSSGPGIILETLSRLTFGLIAFLFVQSRRKSYYLAVTDRRLFFVETSKGLFSSQPENLGVDSLGFRAIKSMSGSSFLHLKSLQVRNERDETLNFSSNALFNPLSNETNQLIQQAPDRVNNYSGSHPEADDQAETLPFVSRRTTIGSIFRWIGKSFKYAAYAFIVILLLGGVSSVFLNMGERPTNSIKPDEQYLDVDGGAAPAGTETFSGEEKHGYSKALTDVKTIVNNAEPVYNPITIMLEFLQRNLGPGRFTGDYDLQLHTYSRGKTYEPPTEISIKDRTAYVRDQRKGRTQVVALPVGPQEVVERIRSDLRTPSRQQLRLASKQDPSSYQQINVLRGNVGVSIPPDWTRTEASSIAHQESSEDQFQENCQFLANQIPSGLEGKDIDKYLGPLERVLKRQYSGYNRTGKQKLEVWGRDALRWEADISIEGTPFKILPQLIQSDETYYQVLCMTRRESFSKHRETITNILDSVVVVEKPAN